jgi:hypothetical protein
MILWKKKKSKKSVRKRNGSIAKSSSFGNLNEIGRKIGYSKDSAH